MSIAIIEVLKMVQMIVSILIPLITIIQKIRGYCFPFSFLSRKKHLVL